ncbi:MAG: fimbrillin family protein [Bacteroidales bacterium]|nr:fimbrillin family protein [Bacteroidales bacterium]
MKKLKYIALVALAALTACTKVEMDSYSPDRKVTFQAAAYVPQTKANVTLWDEFHAFKAKAFLHADRGDGYTSETQDFFGTADNNHIETITPYQDGGSPAASESNTSFWAPSHDYYWPKSANSYLNFIAWYDKNGRTPATSSETSLSWTGYTVQGDDNLLYADEAWHYNLNTTNDSHYTGDRVTNGVPMLFHHALAQVAFKASATNATSGDYTRSVAITSFSLSNVYSTGSLELTNAGSETTATVPWEVRGNGWATSGTAAPMAATIASGSSISVTGDAVNLIPMRTVLPQTVTGSMMLTIEYDIVTKKNGADFSVEHITFSKSLRSLVSIITEWGMGHMITYTLVFNLSTDSILIQPTLENWEYNGGNVTVE